MQISEYKKLARKPNKYRAVRTTVDNIPFDSKLESRKYQELKLLERTGAISDLTLQPSFPIIWNGQKITIVKGDFQFVEHGKTVVIDAKGFDNQLSKLKRKLVVAFYPHLDWRVVKS